VLAVLQVELLQVFALGELDLQLAVLGGESIADDLRGG